MLAKKWMKKMYKTMNINASIAKSELFSLYL